MKKDTLLWKIEIKALYYSDESAAFNVYFGDKLGIKINKGICPDCTYVMKLIGNYIYDCGFPYEETIIFDNQLAETYS